MRSAAQIRTRMAHTGMADAQDYRWHLRQEQIETARHMAELADSDEALAIAAKRREKEAEAEANAAWYAGDGDIQF